MTFTFRFRKSMAAARLRPVWDSAWLALRGCGYAGGATRRLPDQSVGVFPRGKPIQQQRVDTRSLSLSPLSSRTNVASCPAAHASSSLSVQAASTGVSLFPLAQQLRRSSGTAALPVATVNRLLEWFGLVGFTKYSKSSMRIAGVRLYVCATEYCDYRALSAAAGLPDTFNSWFLLTELHVWLIMVRLAGEGKEGRFVRNQLVNSMWEDVNARSKKLLEGGSSAKRREALDAFGNLFKGALFAYDEGLLSDDRVLAAALWRNMFEMKPCEPQSLELMVEYVRKQVWHLEKQDSAVVLSKGMVTFLPYNSESVDLDRTKHVMTLVDSLR